MEELCRGTFRLMVEFALAVAASRVKLLSELHAQSLEASLECPAWASCFAKLRLEGYQQPRSVDVQSGSPEVLFPPVIGNERNGI
jgi:hypothetical protein